MTRPNLVIVRAGNKSLHPEWLQGDSARNWDIIVNYYGDDPDMYVTEDVTRIDSKGPKWPALHDLIVEHRELIAKYEYVWLPDDDLRASKPDINQIFDLCRKHGLKVAQPALTWNSYFGHLTTLKSTPFILRYTNYVEVMAPCLSADMLDKALPLFNSNLSGWGLDFVWSQLAELPERQIGIIDAVTVQHTRPVGGPNYKALRERGISPWDELRAFCRMHGLDEEPTIMMYEAVGVDGKIVNVRKRSRWVALKTIIAYLPALRHTPERQRMLRRLAGMTWKAIRNIPDRVSELSLTQVKPIPSRTAEIQWPR